MENAARSLLLFLLVVTSLVLFVAGNCTSDYNCKGHGRCVHSICMCHDGYAGDDCSIEDELLDDDASGSIAALHWKYYHVEVTNEDGRTTGLSIDVSQKSVYGDVDVYIQRDSHPTMKNYLISDVSTDRHMHFVIDNPPVGTYYIGLFGYWTVQYEISAEILRRCTVDCGEHGTCHRADNTCRCDMHWIGPFCTVYQYELSQDEVYEGSLQTNNWDYFSVFVDEGERIEVTVKHAENVDIDIYMRRNGRPTFQEFDAFNTSLSSESFLAIPMTEENDMWYIGLWAFIGGSYTVTLTEGVARCPMDCSSHGTCEDGIRCICEENYSGGYCEEYVPTMEFDQEYTGTIGQGGYNYYRFAAFTENDVDIHWSADNDGDCELLVRHNANPTLWDFDYVAAGYWDEWVLTVEDPMSNIEWHLGIYCWSYASYTLQVTEPECDCVDDSRGSCESSNICICHDGWAGPRCLLPMQTLENGQVIQDETILSNRWMYYEIRLEASSALFLSLREKFTQGRMALYMDMQEYPITDRYQYKEDGNSDLHDLRIYFKQPQTRTAYVGVLARPSLVDGNGVYSLTAWSPPF